MVCLRINFKYPAGNLEWRGKESMYALNLQPQLNVKCILIR